MKYAELEINTTLVTHLRAQSKEVNPDAIGSKVISAMATQKGGVLILLDRGSNKEGFTEEMKGVIEGLDEVRGDSKKVSHKIRDLDPLSTAL